MHIIFAFTYDAWLNDYHLQRLVIESFSELMYIYPYASLVLYAVVTYASASICNLTNNQMRRLKDQNEKISHRECSNHLEKWKQRQELLNQTVEAINNCFGWTLLLTTYCFSISIVSTSFFIFTAVIGQPLSQVLNMCGSILNYTITLAIICFQLIISESRWKELLYLNDHLMFH